MQKTDKRKTHCFKTFIILNTALGFLWPSCIFWECLGLAIDQIKCHHWKLEIGPMVPSFPSVIRIRSDTSEIILRITNLQWKILCFNHAITQSCQDKSLAKKPRKMVIFFPKKQRPCSKNPCPICSPQTSPVLGGLVIMIKVPNYLFSNQQCRM